HARPHRSPHARERVEKDLPPAEGHQRVVGERGAVRPVGRDPAHKGVEQFAHGGLGQVACDEDEPGAMVVVGPNTCCTPCTTTGVSGISASCTMPLTRSSFLPCDARSNSRNISSALVGTGWSVTMTKERMWSSCRLRSRCW